MNIGVIGLVYVSLFLEADALMLVTEWKEFRSPDFDLMQSKMSGNLFIDGRNQFKSDFIAGKGFKYLQIGVKG